VTRLGKRQIGPTLGGKNLFFDFSLPNPGRAPRDLALPFFNEIEPRDFVEEYRPDLLFSASAGTKTVVLQGGEGDNLDADCLAISLYAN
jgi:hypothetical protein